MLFCLPRGRFRGALIFGMEHRMSIIAPCKLAVRGGLLGIALLLGLPVATSVADSVPVLAYVAAKNANPKRLEVFRQGLTELGYVEGKNIRLDYREAVLDGEYHRVMAELVGSKVDIILAANIASAVAAAKATSSIPIVLLAVNDPVGAGLVKSLERPGTNVTGTRCMLPN
jgi:putative ABC transport system substrate-binding protein